jgi:hypothetical protein
MSDHGLLCKGDVIAYLKERARSWDTDADTMAALGDPALTVLVPDFRSTASTLRVMAAQFAHHGPLPRLPGAWYAHAQSHAARCPDWPEGCGEYARREGKDGTGPASVKHRDGCKVGRLLAGEAVHDD